MLQVSPSQWGAKINYDTKDWKPWNPDKWVIHYVGGVTAAGVAPFSMAKEMTKLQQIENHHVHGNGWQGIAYNYAIGQTGTLYRLRGEQRSGATSGDADKDGIPENHEARAVLFILGGSQTPSEASLSAFSEFWATDPMSVIGHRDSTDTECPGDKLYQWIQEGGYEDMAITDADAQKIAAAVHAANMRHDITFWLQQNRIYDWVNELVSAHRSKSLGVSVELDAADIQAIADAIESAGIADAVANELSERLVQ